MTIYDAAVRQQAIRRQNLIRGQRKSSRVTLPCPLKGLNTRAPINQLGPDEAYELTNFVPDAGHMKLREGSTSYRTMAGQVGSLMTWSYEGTDRLIVPYDAGANNAIGVDDGSSTYASAINSLWWSSAMMNGLLGMVNGTDTPLIYDGAIYPGSFSTMTITGPPNPNNLKGIKIFKSRSYFWGSKLGFWYSAVNALGGALTYFPLETVAQRGGQIMSINTWSQDAGSGPDDFFVITTTRGEVIVYQGSNPNDANDWSLVGRFRIGTPLEQAAFLEVDGRIYVLTQTDLEVLPDKFVRQQALSRLSGALRENYQDYGSNGGQKLFYDPVRDRILLNIPTGSTYDQLVKTSFGYTRFTGINAESYTVYNDEVYFSYGSSIYRWGGAKDRGTAAITFSAKTGYSMLGGNGEKRVAMYRPNMKANGTVSITSALDLDHKGHYSPEQTISMSGGTTPWGSPWGSAWDIPSSDRGEWLVGYGTGQSISLSLSGSSSQSLEWMATDLELVGGGMY